MLVNQILVKIFSFPQTSELYPVPQLQPAYSAPPENRLASGYNILRSTVQSQHPLIPHAHIQFLVLFMPLLKKETTTTKPTTSFYLTLRHFQISLHCRALSTAIISIPHYKLTSCPSTLIILSNKVQNCFLFDIAHLPTHHAYIYIINTHTVKVK